MAAVLALVVAAVLWPPGLADRVAATDDSLSWALSLPQSAYLLLLADGLRDAAARGDDPGLRTWWTTTAALAAAALGLPVLVLGGDLVVLGAIAALVSLLTVVLVVVLGLASARATWAGGPGPQDPIAGAARPRPSGCRGRGCRCLPVNARPASAAGRRSSRVARSAVRRRSRTA